MILKKKTYTFHFLILILSSGFYLVQNIFSVKNTVKQYPHIEFLNWNIDYLNLQILHASTVLFQFNLCTIVDINFVVSLFVSILFHYIQS